MTDPVAMKASRRYHGRSTKMRQISIVELVTGLRRAPRPIHEELKPERVQEELRSMPDWNLLSGGKTIQSAMGFTSERAAAHFAAFASATAADLGQPVHLTLNGKTVTVKLFAPRIQGRATPLDSGVLAFARQIN
jgi:pterin-4a-carbinolamine dehydratase